MRAKVRKSSWESRFLHQGVMYVFDEFFGDMYMVNYIQQIYRMHRRRGAEENLPGYLRRALLLCCISERHKGFRCIFDCAMEIYRNPRPRPLTGEIYPLVAAMHSSDKIRVEKNIRDSIKNAWSSGGADVIPDFLGCSAERAPTNSQLIMGLVERMREFVFLYGVDPGYEPFGRG